MKKLFFVCLCLWSTISIAQSISGNVIDKNGMAVSGVSVRILNTNFLTTTDEAGKFNFSKITDGIYILKFSAVGFASQNETVNTQNTQKLTVILKESAIRLDEMVVSAEKVEQEAQKLPLALSVITSQQVDDYRLIEVKDVAALVPNFNIVNPGDGKNNMSLRGIASASYDQPIATYVDGVNQIRLDAYIPQLLDVERIEVLRGPQGTLYGRNAMGGVINIITKQPSNETKGFAEISMGDYGQQRISAGIKMPLIKDKLFFGVAGMYSHQDGFYTNIYNNTKFDQAHAFLGNYYLKYLASPKFSMTLNVKHYNRRNNGSFPLVNSVAQAFADPYKVNYNAVATDIDNTLESSLSLNYFGNKIDFTSITAYQRNTRYYSAPIDADVQLPFKYESLDVNSIEINNTNGENTVKFWTQELRINSSLKNKSRLTWTAGSFLFTQNDPTNQALLVGTDGANFGQPGGPYKVQTSAQQNNFGIAFYGHANYNLTDKLVVTAGVRYDYENQKLTVGSKFVQGSYIQVLQSDTTGKTNFAAFSPKVALSYHLSENANISGALLYASYSRGFRTGGLSQISYDPSEAPLVVYKPEYSNNFEIGLKTFAFEHRLKANLAVFATQVTDAQVPTLLPNLGFRTAITNAGSMRASGVELELASTPIRNLQIDYNFGYTDAYYTVLNLTASVNDQVVVVSYANNRQILTPNITSMLAVQYGIPLTKGVKLIARGEWKHFGKQYFDLQNNISQNAYDLLNSKIGISTKRFDLMFWGRNLADKLYLGYAYSFGAAALGNPRTIGVTLSTRF